MDPNTQHNAPYSYLPSENQGQHPSNYPYNQNAQQGYPYLPPPQQQSHYPSSQYPQSQNFEQRFVMPNYIPPNQYNEQAYLGAPPEPARLLMTAETSEIDRRLNGGWYKCYVVWLYFLIVLAVVDLIQTVFYVFALAEIGGFLASFICAAWIIYQSSLEISAIQSKSFTKANRALVSMVVYAVLNLMAVIALAVWFADFESIDYRRRNHDLMEDYIFALLVISCCCFAIHMCITLFGAVKVRNVLKRRQALIEPRGYVV